MDTRCSKRRPPRPPLEQACESVDLIRELRNAIERAMLLIDRESIEPEDFTTLSRAAAPMQFRLPPEGVSLDDVERQLVVQALERAGGNQTHAAQLLGINRDQVRYRIEKVRPAHRARQIIRTDCENSRGLARAARCSRRQSTDRLSACPLLSVMGARLASEGGGQCGTGGIRSRTAGSTVRSP